jgi:hypothetical protein
MKFEAKSNCPLNGFSPCKQLECAWFIQIRGKNPNTGEDVDEWGCAQAWLPILMIENSQQQRSTGAAVESFRNEMVRANENSQNVLLATMQQVNPDIKVIEVKQ